MDMSLLKKKSLKNINNYTVIFGLSHFYMTPVSIFCQIKKYFPGLKLSVSFSEASMHRNICTENNCKKLKKYSEKYLKKIRSGHFFCIVIEKIEECYFHELRNIVLSVLEVVRVYFIGNMHKINISYYPSPAGDIILGVL